MAGEVNFVRAHIDQLTEIMEIVAEAQEYFRKMEPISGKMAIPTRRLSQGISKLGTAMF